MLCVTIIIAISTYFISVAAQISEALWRVDVFLMLACVCNPPPTVLTIDNLIYNAKNTARERKRDSERERL